MQVVERKNYPKINAYRYDGNFAFFDNLEIHWAIASLHYNSTATVWDAKAMNVQLELRCGEAGIDEAQAMQQLSLNVGDYLLYFAEESRWEVVSEVGFSLRFVKV